MNGGVGEGLITSSLNPCEGGFLGVLAPRTKSLRCFQMREWVEITHVDHTHPHNTCVHTAENSPSTLFRRPMSSSWRSGLASNCPGPDQRQVVLLERQLSCPLCHLPSVQTSGRSIPSAEVGACGNRGRLWGAWTTFSTNPSIGHAPRETGGCPPAQWKGWWAGRSNV